MTVAPKSVDEKSALPLRGFSGRWQVTGTQSREPPWVQVPSCPHHLHHTREGRTVREEQENNFTHLDPESPTPP